MQPTFGRSLNLGHDKITLISNSRSPQCQYKLKPSPLENMRIQEHQGLSKTFGAIILGAM